MKSVFDKKETTFNKFFSRRNASKHSLDGSVAVIQSDEMTNSQKSVIVIGQEDLNILYYIHQDRYKSVGEMVEKLKEILVDENDEEAPEIIILDSDQKVQYKSAENTCEIIDSQKMVEVPNLEVTVERTKKVKKPRAHSKASTDCSDEEKDYMKAPRKPKKKSVIKNLLSNSINYAKNVKYEKACKF